MASMGSSRRLLLLLGALTGGARGVTDGCAQEGCPSMSDGDIAALLQSRSSHHAVPTAPSFAERGAPVCFSGLQTVGEYLTCLASVPIEPARRDCALDIIFEQLRSLYTYSDLIENSMDHNAVLPPGIALDVHPMELGRELSQTEKELRKETSAGSLALKLTAMFGKLQDAHTGLYVNPLFHTKISPPFTIDVKLDPVTKDMQLVVVEAASWSPKTLEGKTIRFINERDPLEYFLEVASITGIDRSPGTRLNRYLRGQTLRSVPPKDGGKFTVTLEGGGHLESHAVEWMVTVPEDACGLDDDARICLKDEQSSGYCEDMAERMQRCFTYNPTFDRMVDLFKHLGQPDIRCSAGGTLASQAAASAARGAGQEGPKVPGAGQEGPRVPLSPLAPKDPPPGETPETPVVVEELVSKSRRRSSAAGDEYIQVVKAVDGSCYALKVDRGNGTFASVLKITSFGPFSDILPCAEAAVDLAAEVSGGRLILDVIGNGGGYVSSGYNLNNYLYANMPGTRMPEAHESCEWYDFPKNDPLTWFVNLGERGLPDLADQAHPQVYIAALAERMERSVEAFGLDPEYFGRARKAGMLQASARCLRTLLSDFARHGVPTKESEAWPMFHSLYNQCVAKAEPLGGARGMDIMSYSPSNVYPEALSPPTWEYYHKTVEKVHGGKRRNFTSLTFLGESCKAYAATYPEVFGEMDLTDGDWPEPQRKLTHITYLSDGTCGSTCSVSSSTPFLEGMATFVTFGGVKGERMDITSFNGGNVGTYQSQHDGSLAKYSLDSFADASIFHPESEAPNWPFLPVPLNIYKLRFAQRAEYPRALGPKALPREWYLIPAPYHLDRWTTHSFKDLGALEAPAMKELRELYLETAAKAPKPFAGR